MWSMSTSKNSDAAMGVLRRCDNASGSRRIFDVHYRVRQGAVAFVALDAAMKTVASWSTKRAQLQLVQLQALRTSM